MTADQPQKQRCEHECVCDFYKSLPAHIRDEPCHGGFKCKHDTRASHSQQDNPVPSSKELMLLAEHDWHNREERRHLHPMIPWTHGWVAGFLSNRKPNWKKEHDAAIRKEERERFANDIAQWIQKHSRYENAPRNLKVVSTKPLLDFIQSLRAGDE